MIQKTICRNCLPALCLAACAMQESLFAQDEVELPVFTDITDTTGFFGSNISWGGAWADFDLDGDLDVYTFSHLPIKAPSLSQLWENNGDGTFTDVTIEKGIDITPADKHAAMWADIDNDGDPDLVIGKGPTQTDFGDEVYENIGGATFVNLPVEAGLNLPNGGRGVASADVDLDGDLDILSLGHITQNAGSNRFFRNEGAMRFTNINDEVGPIASGENNRAAAWADYDNDGNPDVMVAPPCVLYRNQGDGSFADVTLVAGIFGSEECQSPAWGDYDNDGDVDLYVTSGLPRVGHTTAGFLYENNGDGTFTDVTVQSGTSNSENARGAVWGDYDNDGFLDLYIVNALNEIAPNVLFRNNGDGTFSNMTASAGVGVSVEGGGADGSFIDYNNDGFLDLFVTNGMGARLGPYVLLQNSTNSNNWLKIKLIGQNNNRDGLMTKLKLVADQRTSFREYNGNSHYMSQDSIPVHFGMGQADAVQTLELTWPDGGKQVIENIAVNQTVTIVEGRTIVRGVPLGTLKPGYTIWLTNAGWNIAWRGGDNLRHTFTGIISTDGVIISAEAVQFEPNDEFSWGAEQISFSGVSKEGPDIIRFNITGATKVTFDIIQDGIAQPGNIHIGKYGVKPAVVPLTLVP